MAPLSATAFVLAAAAGLTFSALRTQISRRPLVAAIPLIEMPEAASITMFQLCRCSRAA